MKGDIIILTIILENTPICRALSTVDHAGKNRIVPFPCEAENVYTSSNSGSSDNARIHFDSFFYSITLLGLRSFTEIHSISIFGSNAACSNEVSTALANIASLSDTLCGWSRILPSKCLISSQFHPSFLIRKIHDNDSGFIPYRLPDILSNNFALRPPTRKTTEFASLFVQTLLITSSFSTHLKKHLGNRLDLEKAFQKFKLKPFGIYLSYGTRNLLELKQKAMRCSINQARSYAGLHSPSSNPFRVLLHSEYSISIDDFEAFPAIEDDESETFDGMSICSRESDVLEVNESKSGTNEVEQGEASAHVNAKDGGAPEDQGDDELIFVGDHVGLGGSVKGKATSREKVKRSCICGFNEGTMLHNRSNSKYCIFNEKHSLHDDEWFLGIGFIFYILICIYIIIY